MHYTEDALGQIEESVVTMRFRYYDLIMKLGAFGNTLKNERAKEYIAHGVTRRLCVLYRCFENIFKLFPADKAERLTDEARMDLEINLHAFLINTYGIIENLGLSLAFENGILNSGTSEKRTKNEIGLFKSKFRKQLNSTLRDYLRRSESTSWYNDYAKNYRDALAHRIPPYIPPSGLDKEEQKQFEQLNRELTSLSKQGYSERYSVIIDQLTNLGKASPFYVHSFSENAKPVYIHPQMIADFRTIEELIEVTISNFYVNSEKQDG